MFARVCLLVTLDNFAAHHVFVAKEEQLRNQGVFIARHVSQVYALVFNRNGVGVVGVVKFGYQVQLRANFQFTQNVGAIVSFIEHLFGVEFLPKSIYFISDMPSDPRMSDVVPIALFSFLLSLAATLYPSWRAARTRPAEALRYE